MIFGDSKCIQIKCKEGIDFVGRMIGERISGEVPDFMKFFPEEVLVNDWPSWKRVGEIDLERARYLLSMDDMFEETLGKIQG